MSHTADLRPGRRATARPVRLVEQEGYTFHYPTTVGPQDISSGGHFGTDNVILLLSRARAHIFHSMGLAEVDLGDATTGIIIVDLTVSFRAEAFPSDEIAVDTHFGAFSKKGFRIYQRLKRGREVIALAETSVLTFDYRSRKVVPIPESFLKALSPQPGI
jgi:acyl-CoA thioesterase FadM